MPRRHQQGRRAMTALLTKRFQFLLSLVNLFASTWDSPRDSQSSRTLSIHLFLGSPLGRVPLICPYNSIFENIEILSGPMHTTCSKYVNCLCFSTISTSLSIPSSFFISMLRLLSLRVTPRIRRRTDISKTWSSRLCSSLSVQVSALYSRIDWTRVWYSLTLVSLVMSGDFHYQDFSVHLPPIQLFLQCPYHLLHHKTVFHLSRRSHSLE